MLKAVRKYDDERGLKTLGCYCGTSVGALNACMAAQGDLDALLELYKSLTTRDVIGEDEVDISRWRLWRRADDSPFNYYANDHLRRLIEANAKFDKLKAQANHLLICVTNFDTGELETFYHSDLIPSFIEYDKRQPHEKQRLLNYHKIDCQATLVSALLASGAIPFFFPPVTIGKNHYVDGGVGNNTPTKQAAYFCRFLAEVSGGTPDRTICVINDPVRFAIDRDPAQYKLERLVLRTMDIYQHELVNDYLVTWDRINKNIAHRRSQHSELFRVIESAAYLDEGQRKNLIRDLDPVLTSTIGGTRQLEMDLLQIRPTMPLEVETLLTFDPTQSKKLVKLGAADCLATLKGRGIISATEEAIWINAL